MYKAVHGHVPDYLSNNLYFSHEVNESNLRSGKIIILHKPLILIYEITKNPLTYKGPSVWNALPYYMKCAAHLQTFKTLYKNLTTMNFTWITAFVIHYTLICDWICSITIIFYVKMSTYYYGAVFQPILYTVVSFLTLHGLYVYTLYIVVFLLTTHPETATADWLWMLNIFNK